MPDNMLQKNHMGIQDVHIWTVCTDEFSDGMIYDMLNLLRSDEKKKAERYHFERDQKKYIIARANLRKILSRYVGLHPSELIFKYNRYGKPYLDGPQSLLFNLSHSENLVLYAFTKKHRIGIDIEQLKRIENLEQIVDYYFTNIEKDQLEQLPPHKRNDAFFRWWTLKEAYIKAKGKGLSLPLNDFSVSFMPGESACLIRSKHEKNYNEKCYLDTIETKKGFIAAIAVEGCKQKKIIACSNANSNDGTHFIGEKASGFLSNRRQSSHI